MLTRRCLLVILFVAMGFPLWADTVKLKDGTALEGEITAEDDATVSIYLEFSHGTITQTRRINREDIAEIIRWTPEQKENWRMQREYEKLQKYQLSPNATYLVEYYDYTIDRVFQKFITDHPDSSYISKVTERIAEWKAERALVSAGNVKLHGRWAPAAEVAPSMARERGQKLLEQGCWLISQRRFESAIQQLQVVIYMKEYPELVSQAKPLIVSACQQAMASLEPEHQQLTKDIPAAEQQVVEARQAAGEAETALARLMNSQQSPSGPDGGDSQSVLQARAALNKARDDLGSAEERLEQLRSRSAVVIQKLTALQSHARAVATMSTAPRASQNQPAPAPSSPDSPEVLVTIVAWVKKNWPALLIALLAILFLMSRFAKD